jgi:predicted ester cyclase
MTAEQNKMLVRRLVEEAVNPRNPDVLDEVAQGEFAVAARRWVRPFRDSFPDFTMEIADLVADGEKVAAHFRCSGTHLGNGWVTRRPAAASPMSMRSTSSG